MKTPFLLSLLACLLAPSSGGDRERGLELYRQGKFPEAVAAFRAAIASEGDSAELQYNIALASWRAGDLAAAETAAEKYAATAANARVDLHAGLLGAVRYDEAKTLEAAADAAGGGQAAVAPDPQAAPPDPLALLEQALAKANQAEEHFVRGATATSSAELLRNAERALRLADELQKKIDELKKQREEQQKQDDEKKDDKKDEKKQDDKKGDDDKKQDDKKSDEDKKKDEQKQQDDKKQDEQKQANDGKQEPQERPEPKPQDQKQDQKQDPQQDAGKQEQQEPKEPNEPKPQEQQAKPGEQLKQAGQERHDAPGEQTEGHELSPEQTQRLLELLKNLDDKAKEMRSFGTTRRRPVERDW